MRETECEKIKQSFKKKICQIFSGKEIRQTDGAQSGSSRPGEDRASFFPLFRILFVAPWFYGYIKGGDDKRGADRFLYVNYSESLKYFW
jgi:hypothetical protein